MTTSKGTGRINRLLTLAILAAVSISMPAAAQPYLVVTFVNLDADAGPLRYHAWFPAGESITTGPVPFGKTGGGSVLTDRLPRTDSILREDGSLYARNFTYPEIHNFLVAYGGGKTIHGAASGFGHILNTRSSSGTLLTRPVNRSEVTQSYIGRGVTYHDIDMYEYAGVQASWSIAPDDWWILHDKGMYMTDEADSMIVDQINRSGDSRALKVDQRVDSALFRLVNLSSRAELVLTLTPGVEVNSGPLDVTRSIATSPEEELRMTIHSEGETLFDTTFVPLPFLHTDLVVRDHGEGLSVLFAERLISRLSPEFYWHDRLRFVGTNTGEIAGGEIGRVNGRSPLYQTNMSLDGTDLFREIQLYSSPDDLRSVPVTDDEGDLVATYDFARHGRDSTVYIFIDRGEGLRVYSYDEFDPDAGTLTEEPLDSVPGNAPWHVVASSFAQAWDSLEIESPLLQEPIRIGHLGNTPLFGPIVGAEMPYDVVDPDGSGISGPADILATGTVTSHPGGYAVILLDDDPVGGVRTLSWSVRPGGATARLRLVNITENRDGFGVYVIGSPETKIIEGVDDGEIEEAVVSEWRELSGWTYVLCNAEGDSLVRIPTSNRADQTIVVDSRAGEPIIRVYVLNQSSHDEYSVNAPVYELSVAASVESTESDNRTRFIQPNPVDDHATVRVDSDISAAGDLLLVDLLGHVVLSRRVAPGEASIRLVTSGLPSGVYTALFYRGERMVFREKVFVW